MKARNTMYVECSCTLFEHTMRLTKFDDGEVCVQYFLPKRPFFHRLVTGIKYILGIENVHGYYSETVLDAQACASVSKFLTEETN